MQLLRSILFLVLFTQLLPAADEAIPASALPASSENSTNAAPPVSAQNRTNNVRAITLEDAIQQALEHNLNLQIERFNPQVALYNLNISSAGYDPTFFISAQHTYSETGGGVDPVTQLPIPSTIRDADAFNAGLGGQLPWGLSYDFSGNITDRYGPNSFEDTRGNIGVDLTQPLLKNFWIDSTRLNIRLNRNLLKRSELSVRQSIMDTVTSVERAYYDLIFAQENVRVQQEALALAERLYSENRKRVEVGVLAPLDEKQSASQVAARRADLLAAEQTLSGQQNVLKALITDNYSGLHAEYLKPSEALTAPKEIFNVQGSWARGLTERPEILQAKLDLENAGYQLRYSRNQLFPQLDLIGSYGYSASGVKEISQGFRQFRDRDFPAYSYGAQLSFPLSNKAARNRFRSSKASMQQNLLSLKQLEQNIMVSIDDAISAAESAFQRVEATKQARLYAESALDAEQKKLESGKSTSFFVLQLQRDLTAARSQEIRALADYNIALANVAREEGSTLERRRVNVDVK